MQLIRLRKHYIKNCDVPEHKTVLAQNVSNKQESVMSVDLISEDTFSKVISRGYTFILIEEEKDNPKNRYTWEDFCNDYSI